MNILKTLKPKAKIQWSTILIIAFIGFMVSHLESSWILWRLRTNAEKEEKN